MEGKHRHSGTRWYHLLIGHEQDSSTHNPSTIDSHTLAAPQRASHVFTYISSRPALQISLFHVLIPLHDQLAHSRRSSKGSAYFRFYSESHCSKGLCRFRFSMYSYPSTIDSHTLAAPRKASHVFAYIPIRTYSKGLHKFRFSMYSYPSTIGSHSCHSLKGSAYFKFRVYSKSHCSKDFTFLLCTLILLVYY